MTNPRIPGAGITGANAVLGGCDTPFIPRRALSFQVCRDPRHLDLLRNFRLQSGNYCQAEWLAHRAVAIREIAG
jgi:hypothetical protein